MSWKVEGSGEKYTFREPRMEQGGKRNVHFNCDYEKHDETGEEEIYQMSFNEISYRLNLEPLE